MTAKKHMAIPVDLHKLGRHPGEMIERHIEVPAPSDLSIAMVGVPEGSPVTIDLTCQSAGDGVLVEGVADVILAGQCARCLSDFERPASYDLQELYFYPGREPEESDDELHVADDVIDLEPVLRAAIVLNLPFSPLCSDDCAGLCQVCGADLNEQPDHVHEAPPDDRWAALATILPQ